MVFFFHLPERKYNDDNPAPMMLLAAIPYHIPTTPIPNPISRDIIPKLITVRANNADKNRRNTHILKSVNSITGNV